MGEGGQSGRKSQITAGGQHLPVCKMLSPPISCPSPPHEPRRRTMIALHFTDREEEPTQISEMGPTPGTRSLCL